MSWDSEACCPNSWNYLCTFHNFCCSAYFRCLSRRLESAFPKEIYGEMEIYLIFVWMAAARTQAAEPQGAEESHGGCHQFQLGGFYLRDALLVEHCRTVRTLAEFYWFNSIGSFPPVCVSCADIHTAAGMADFGTFRSQRDRFAGRG